MRVLLTAANMLLTCSVCIWPLHLTSPPTVVAPESTSLLIFTLNSQWATICTTEEDVITLSYLIYGFPAGYEGPVPTPSQANHPSAINHRQDVEAAITKEIIEGAMLGPFDSPPFTPWTQTNPLLTRPKKDSHSRRVIMDLSWPLPPGISVNGCNPKDSCLGEVKKMQQPSASKFCDLIR